MTCQMTGILLQFGSASPIILLLPGTDSMAVRR